MTYPNTYCVFDFETSGLDHMKDKVIEVGLLAVVDGKQVMRSDFLIKWPGLVLPQGITALTGITQEMIDKDGKEPEEAIKFIREMIDGKVLIGHNIFNFDLKFLEQLLNPTILEYESWMNNFIDTAAHFKASKIGVVRKPDQDYRDWVREVMETRAYGVRFNVSVCCDELGIDKSSGQHRAMNDVLLTEQIYRKLCLEGVAV